MVFGIFGKKNDNRELKFVLTLITDKGSRILLRVYEGQKLDSAANLVKVYQYFLYSPLFGKNEFEVTKFVSDGNNKEDFDIESSMGVDVKKMFLGKRIRYKTSLSTNLITKILDGDQLETSMQNDLEDLKRAA